MLAVIRYTVPESQSQDFAKQGQTILDTFAGQPGFLRGRLARSVDEPNLWALVTEWEGAGFYRRALSAARLVMYPLMILMVNEPSAYEDVHAQDGT
ncbi:Antibiotic biosynthesis monooxygenase [Nonomuraea wenchangensis]|uniref:Antibiotic biosynthesis monooxygenase n=1 Tax=Nonomuraea wenchangensis TaxID=568860 RepID=A0A1I0JVQ3_9ACTN|nr:antibiotic biosynthesis monooxygenase family protein [Nonomuraea wenchangensis]SEU14837.1 Antibiotic biosynthesis monooxygenase [Nonomuraea wenchangensis]